MKEYEVYVAGEWVDKRVGASVIVDPATGEEVSTVPALTAVRNISPVEICGMPKCSLM